MPIGFHLDPLAFAVMLAASLAITALATIVPALRASATRAVDLLRCQ
jgi:ABC-type lipoprotein release transport system permease subunit